MNDNKVIAERIFKGNLMYMRVVGNPDVLELPPCLFSDGTSPFTYVREIPYTKFIEWLKCRVVPENRDKADLERILKYHKMDRYDAFELAYKCNGVLTCMDKFWVDWEEPDRKQENPICW